MMWTLSRVVCVALSVLSTSVLDAWADFDDEGLDDWLLQARGIDLTSVINDDILSDFVQNPGHNQHLLLVPRGSDNSRVLRLTRAVTDRLRYAQSTHYSTAIDLMQKPSWEQEHEAQQLLEEVLQLQKRRGTENASQRMRDIEDDHVVALELQSHPGRYIAPLTKNPKDAGFMMLNHDNYVELGISSNPQEAVRVLLQPAAEMDAMERLADFIGLPNPGRRYVLETSNRMVLSVGADVFTGAPVIGTMLAEKSGSFGMEQDLFTADFDVDEHCQFAVNEDGSLSPVTQPDLAIGIAAIPSVHLVPRDSSNRLLFARAPQDWTLKSHPGLAMVATRRYTSSKILLLQSIGIGHVAHHEMLTLHPLDNRRHGEVLLMSRPTLQEDGSAVLVGMDLLLEEGAPVMLLAYKREEFRSNMVADVLREAISTSRNATWIINQEDGSISPLNAPWLALGCEQLAGISQTDSLVSKEKQKLVSMIACQVFANKAIDDDDVMSPEDRRILHVAVVILFVHGFSPYIAFVCGLLALILLKSTPWKLCLVGLAGLCFGSSTALLCLFLMAVQAFLAGLRK